MKKAHVQQGDVLFKRVNSIPEGVTPTKSNVLASGEHTGHHHEINVMDVAANDVEIFDTKDGLKFVKNSKTITIQHPEHKSVTLEPGIWQIGGVREYDYFEEMARRVAD